MNICPRDHDHKSQLTKEIESIEWVSFVGQHRKPREGTRREYLCLDCGTRWISFAPYGKKNRKP
jgi:hypothetical protein